jgi:transcriptional regulator with XRE-family HTH domain
MTIEKRIERARIEVAKRLGEQAEIARAMGVSYSWLRRFISGKIVEPGAIKFDRLEQWLKSH